MSNYRRTRATGACYFFTVVTYKRQALFTNENNIDTLREAFRVIKNKHPFTINAITILPDHLHTIWQLPPNDANFSLRWRLIKHFVSTKINTSKNHRNEKQIWQRRFWEHLITDNNDWQRHMDYIHYNPVKHGYTNHPGKWKFSSFSTAVKKGWYDSNWGASEPENIKNLILE